jgi:hypothetical protein
MHFMVVGHVAGTTRFPNPPRRRTRVVSHDLERNRLLAVLPRPECDRWLIMLEPVELRLGQVLHESGVTLSHVYFPTTAIVSLLYVMANGAAAEIALVGDDGIVGVSLFMGGESTTSRAVVQSAGRSFRLKAQQLMDEFNRNGPLLHLLLRYTQALITQMAQTAVCNRHHSLDQQAMPVAAGESGSTRGVRTRDDAGTDRQYAGRAARGSDGSRDKITGCRTHTLYAWPHYCLGSGWAGTAYLRMLCGRAAGIRAPAAATDSALDRR